MKCLRTALSAFVFSVALFFGAVLLWYVSQYPVSNMRGTRTLFSVLVENHEDARPYHRGLERAVLIEEFFVEGFISRLSAFFLVTDIPESVGPVRSLRPYFLDAALPWSSIFFHIGGSPEALERVGELGVTSFNGIYRDTYFPRKDGVPSPHDAFLTKKSVQELLSEVERQGDVDWPPYETGRVPQGPGAETITINFFSPLHNVEYVYDAWRKKYIRKNGKEVSLATPRNVLILETDVEEVGPFGRLAIAVQGEGDALLFRTGKVYEGRWSKASVSAPYRFTDISGEPLVFAKGQTWMTVVDSLRRVEWE